MYRLLSGLHSHTTISIAKNFHPVSERSERALMKTRLLAMN